MAEEMQITNEELSEIEEATRATVEAIENQTDIVKIGLEEICEHFLAQRRLLQAVDSSLRRPYRKRENYATTLLSG